METRIDDVIHTWGEWTHSPVAVSSICNVFDQVGKNEQGKTRDTGPGRRGIIKVVKRQFNGAPTTHIRLNWPVFLKDHRKYTPGDVLSRTIREALTRYQTALAY